MAATGGKTAKKCGGFATQKSAVAALHDSVTQGQSWQTGFFELALTDRNVQVKLCLKAVFEILIF